MRRIPLRFVLLACVLTGVNVGGWVWLRHELLARRDAEAGANLPTPMLRVLSVTPFGDADEADRVTLQFDEPLVEPDACNARLAHAPFAIEPQPPGHWEWAAPDQLVYLLEEKLPAGRRWEIRPTSDAAVTLRRRLIGETEFTIQTRPLRMTGSRITAHDGEAMTIELTFNQPVHPDDLLRHLAAADSQNARAVLDVQSLVREPDDELTIRVTMPASRSVDLSIDEALTGHGAERSMIGPMTRRLSLSPRFRFSGVNVSGGDATSDPRVSVRFSAIIAADQDTPRLALSPHVDDVSIQLSRSTCTLQGKFEAGRRYRLTLPATLLAADGQTLGEEQTITFDVPDRRPSLNLPVSRGILMPDGNLTLDLKTVNVDKLSLKAWRLHANNLVPHLRGQHASYTSRELVSRDIKLAGPKNEPRELALDLKELLKQPGPGIYRVQLRADRPYWLRDDAVVALTDLALTAKKERGKYLVWVTSLRTAKPVAGVKVAAVTATNQTLSEAETDAQGLATLNAPDGHPDGPVWVITAQLAGDLSYVQPDRRQWVIDDVDQSGREHPTTYDAMLYCERGVYRPGDVIHLTGIVREPDGALPATLPLAVRVVRPDGKQVAELPIDAKPDAQGVFHVEYETAADGQTGKYRFKVGLPGSTRELGEATALVEAFVPMRMEVTATPIAARFGAEEKEPGQDGAEERAAKAAKPAFDVAADYLFGQPAAKLPVTLAATLRRVDFESKRFAGFSFSDGAPRGTTRLEEVTGALDERGRARIELALPEELEGGEYQINATVTVTEPGGRSVSRNTGAAYDNLNRHLGLRFKDQIAPVDQPLTARWCLVDGDDEPRQPRGLHLLLERIEYDWIIEEVNGRRVWKSKQRFVKVIERRIPEDALASHDNKPGEGSLDFTCPEGGNHRLTLTEIGTTARARVSFYASRYADDGPPVESPEKLELVLDKAKHAPGSEAALAVRSPFAGTLLLTVETDRIVQRHVIAMESRTIEMKLPVDATLRGSAYISASVVRAIDPSRDEWLPHRAMGMARLEIDHSAAVPSLVIDAPSDAEPGQTITVKVKTDAIADVARDKARDAERNEAAFVVVTDMLGAMGKPHGFCGLPVRLHDERTGKLRGLAYPWRPANDEPLITDAQRTNELQPRRMLHVWAVDDGILLTTNYRTPDPALHFHAPRASYVRGGDVFADLLPDHRRAAGIERIGAGGDEDELMRLRRSPVPMKQAAPAVVWRAAEPVGPDGLASIELHLPDVTGRMRVMAVLVDGDRYASTSHAVTLASPLLVEASWPRFAAPGDAFDVPVKLFNATEQPLEVDLSLAMDGPVSARLPQPRVTVGPGEPMTVWLKAKANGLGAVSAVVTARATSRELSRELTAKSRAEFAVRPITPLHNDVALKRIKAGDGIDIKPAGSIEPAHARIELSISGSPTVELRPALEQLIRYPYGCVEQTTSGLLVLLHVPQLYEADRDATGGDDNARAAAVRRMIDAGIARLWSMQTRSGGLAYWPGGTQPNRWGTAYAAAFLVEAKRAGFAIDKRFTDELAKYLLAELNKEGNDRVDANTRALFCRVLAAFDRPQHGWMARLTERIDDLDMAGRAHLAAGWLEAGRKDRAAALFKDDGALAMRIATTTRGRFTSQARQEAVLLSVLLEIDANHAWSPRLVQRLQGGRSNGHWGTTLNNASVIAALAKYQASHTQKSEFTGNVLVDGKVVASFDHTKPALIRIDDAAKPVRIKTDGEGEVFVTVSTEGLAKPEAMQPFDRNLTVRRRWLNRDGEPIDPATIRVGDLVRVEIELAAPQIDRHDAVGNIAMVDALPAGFEVENPRLATSASEDDDRATPSATPDRVEFLDDRVVLFSDAGRNPRVFRYAIRAITAGEFDAPPMQASCMYDPAFASMTKKGRVTVQRN